MTPSLRMNAWTFILMAVVTLIWVGMAGAVAYLAGQKVSACR
jgi:membrane protein DedA with SNARE-associated domain